MSQISSIREHLEKGATEYIIESYGEVHVYTLCEEQLKVVSYTKEEFSRIEKERDINIQFDKDLNTILKDPT